ncbi:hypothetical protein, partial [Geobacillus stearothermophilus]|uniref:hypothetical protein n=1 Tax=Geobacillus stearothermophilus TaxID=1422 RepID=UPI001C7DAC53
MEKVILLINILSFILVLILIVRSWKKGNILGFIYLVGFITKSCTCTCHESMLAVSSRTRNAKRWIFLYPYPRRFISLI